ncbi:hypothetical protein HWI79_2428 [Cryptosporidium felis]|nr:hypothetical protein HWI79_2428 [Cryptosporidium felis]
MDSQVIINQVLEEIRQSIALINESFGIEKCETSSLSNLPVSTIFDVCDVQIVDELPQMHDRVEDSLVIPFEDSQQSLSNSQDHDMSSNFIIIAPPNSTTHGDPVGTSWGHQDDCESTSEGSFLTGDELDDDASDFGTEMCDFNEGIRNIPNPLERERNFFQFNNSENYLEIFGCNHIGGPGERQFREAFPMQLSPNIPLLHESIVEPQENSRSLPRNSANILKRQFAPDITDQERDFKMIKCESQVPTQRDSFLY